MAFRPKIKNTDGTLTDLPIAAETAKQLKSSRSIGLSGVVATSRSFNGTSAITIPVTAVPATLLTGIASINTTGRAASAIQLVKSWTRMTPGATVLPYGTYLIKVDIADGASGIGYHCSIITDIIDMQEDSKNLYNYRHYDLPAGPIHTYCANFYESTWFRSARIKITETNSTGFKLNLFVSPSGIYETSNVTGAMLYPSKQYNMISDISCQMHYKKIM